MERPPDIVPIQLDNKNLSIHCHTSGKQLSVRALVKKIMETCSTNSRILAKIAWYPAIYAAHQQVRYFVIFRVYITAVLIGGKLKIQLQSQDHIIKIVSFFSTVFIELYKMRMSGLLFSQHYIGNQILSSLTSFQ